MDYHCYADVVKFIAHNVFEGENKDIKTLLSNPEAYVDHEFVNEWKYVGSIDIGKNKHLYTEQWIKNDEIIYALNESKYSNVGEVELSIVADNKELIEEFCQDHKLEIRFGIKEDDTAKCWG
jgi:hypothetical protein